MRFVLCGLAACIVVLSQDAVLAQEFGAWETFAPLPAARQEVGVAFASGEVYVIGGFARNPLNQTVSVNTVEAYDPRTNTWRSIPDLPAPSPLNHLGIVGLDDQVYVIGGLTQSFSAVASVYRYDPVGNQWETLADLPLPRGALGVAAVNGLIYAAGGLRNLSSVADFAVYDPGRNHWDTLPPMPTARDHLAAGAIHGRFYAVGGRFNGALRGALEVYDPDSHQWHGSPDYPAIPTPRAGIAAAVIGARLYVFGGEGNPANPPPNGPGTFAETEVYDADTNQWQRLADMPFPRHGIGAAVVGNRIHIPGGAPIQGFTVTNHHDAFLPPLPAAIARWPGY